MTVDSFNVLDFLKIKIYFLDYLQ